MGLQHSMQRQASHEAILEGCCRSGCCRVTLMDTDTSSDTTEAATWEVNFDPFSEGLHSPTQLFWLFAGLGPEQLHRSEQPTIQQMST